LLDPQYDKALESADVLEGMIMEAEAKDRLILEGEMLENLLESEDLSSEEIKKL